MRVFVCVLSLSLVAACDRLKSVAGDPNAAEDASAATAAAQPSAAAAPSAAADDDDEACENIAGTWQTKGTCGPDTCVITQAGCTTSFKCSNGAASYTGSVAGRAVSYAGTAANGKPGSCAGTFDGTTLSGTCQGGGAPCTFTATRKGPAPAAPQVTAARTAATTTPPATTPVATPAAATPAAPSNAACENIAGTWTTGGTCGPDTCVITQNGCTTNFRCSDGAASYTGTVTGTSVAYAGLANGKPGSCRGTVKGRTIAGTCQTAGVTCAFTATKR